MKKVKQILETWLPTIVILSIVIGVVAAIFGAALSIMWMFFTGLLMFFGGLAAAKWII